MKLNLNFNLLGLDGKEILVRDANGGETPVGMGKQIANLLADKVEGFSAIKAYDFAVQMYNGKEIEIDNADLEILKRFVENNNTLSNLSKAQLLRVIKEAENESQHGR